MGRVQHGSRTKGSAKSQGKARKTKRYTRDLDQIHGDLSNPSSLPVGEVGDTDLPGEGKFYCTECARHFIDEGTRAKHRRSKVHRRRVKELKDEPYDLKEAEMAAGLGTDNSRHTMVADMVVEA
ncbi:hypothetical protein BT69DRAFT_1348136 [Atractiella rhizophila]|nr:hypothetical protein BT69DRAFT_1348136 [Atractiella rhizophila]